MTTWITGASSGIGEALAVACARQGRQVVLSARRQDELERVRRRCIEAGAGDDQILVLPLDITDHAAMAPAVERALSRFGAIGVLINNAGIGQRSLFVDTDIDVYRRLFEVDLMGQIAMTKAVLPVMLDQGRGHIAVVASIAGKIGVSYRTGYCAAKHAVIGFFDSLRAELDGSGIQVSTILPGFVRTNISVAALTADGSAFGVTDRNIARGMDPDDCARIILRGLARGKAEIPVAGGPERHTLWLKRFFPAFVRWLAPRVGEPHTEPDRSK